MTEKEYYEKIKAEYEASTDYKLVEWARPYFEGTKKPNSKDRYVVCSVSDRAADDIMRLTNKEVHGFVHAISCSNIRHIDLKHGIKGKSNQSMRDIADLGRLAYVLNNYDYIDSDGEKIYGVLDKHGKPSDLIKFIKRIDGHVITAEAVTDSPNKKTLYIRSVYKAKTIQKESRMDDNKNSRPHVRNAYGLSDSILPQPDKNVNSESEKNPGALSATPKTPTFAEIAAKYKDYRPPRKPPTSGNNDGKGSSDRGDRGR